MTTEIQLYGSQVKRAAPITLQGQWFADALGTLAQLNDADLLDEGDALSAADFVRIRMPQNANYGWMLPFPSEDQHGNVSDETMLPAIDGVILAMRPTRLYWRDAFTGAGTRPDCVSIDGITGTGEPGGSCHICQFNQWGSALEGNGKACAQRTELYILTPLSPFPIVVSAPPTSYKALRQYRLGVFGQSGKAYHKVVTRLELETASNAGGIDYPRIKPKLLCLPPAAEAEAIANVRDQFVALIKGSDVVVDAETVDETSAGDMPGPRGDTSALQAHNAQVAEAAGVGDQLPF